jgi:hypothetical protein
VSKDDETILFFVPLAEYGSFASLIPIPTVAFTTGSGSSSFFLQEEITMAKLSLIISV